MLPFSWPFANALVVVPARALTPAQFHRLLTILERQGFFADGDHRSKLGQLMGWIFDRGPDERDGHLTRFPRLTKASVGRPTKGIEKGGAWSAEGETETGNVLVPSIVIRRSWFLRLLGARPLMIGSDWIKVPFFPLRHWREIARIDRDPRRPIVMRLWTFAEGRSGGEVNEIPMSLGLKAYTMSPDEVARIVEEQFELSRRGRE